MNFFLNSVIWSLLLGYSNNEKKEGGPRIGYGDIKRQRGGIFQFSARFCRKSDSVNKFELLDWI